MPGETRVVIRFDHHPGHTDKGKIGIALYVARYYVGTMANGDGLPIQEYVVWTGHARPLKSGRLSRDTWAKWKVIAMTVQRHVDTMPRNQLEDMVITGRVEALCEIANRIVSDTRRRESMAKKGCVYNRGGWRVVHPLSTVWGVSAPDYMGFVTAVVDPDSETVMVDVAPTGGQSRKFKSTGLREGIIQGLQRLHKAVGRLVEVIEIERILDAAGVRNELASILDIKVHRYLSRVIVSITDAAHEGGTEGINAALKQLLAEVETVAETLTQGDAS